MMASSINTFDTEFVNVSPRIGAPVLGMNPAIWFKIIQMTTGLAGKAKGFFLAIKTKWVNRRKQGELMKKLYVSNLSFNANENDVSTAFEPFGTIEEVKVITDRDTGKSRGFGFVTFAEPDEAQAAIKALNGTEVMGRTIKVEVAQDKPRNNNNRSQGNREGYRSSRY